jgi:ABC-type branched-subunit amino acid transport system substrate-binding protein
MTLASKLVAAVCLVLLVITVLVVGQRNEARRQRDDALRELAAVTADRATLRSNVLVLKDAIDTQNRAIDQWRAEALLRQQKGVDALKTAQDATRALVERNRVLHTIIQTTHPETCDATFDAARAGL